MVGDEGDEGKLGAGEGSADEIAFVVLNRASPECDGGGVVGEEGGKCLGEEGVGDEDMVVLVRGRQQGGEEVG